MASIILLIAYLFGLTASSEPCVKWGNTFDVPLQSSNVKRDCQIPGNERPISVCCAAVANYSSINGISSSSSNIVTRGVGIDFVPDAETKAGQKKMRNKQGKVLCEVKKEYFSSPLELHDLVVSQIITASSEVLEERLHTLMTYVTSDEFISNSTRWLNRVQEHMQSESTPPETADDRQFLSRFEFTRTCGTEVDKWTEWIEPITITARHPFAFATCLDPTRKPYSKYYTKGKPRVARSNVDYVLVQSGRNLYNQSFSNGRRFRNVPQRGVGTSSSSVSGGGGGGAPKRFMFDAGTSTFDSSLVWFTCAYSQRKVSFDQVYGWEMTLLEPTDYWKRVPPNWKPYWHFHNIPISAVDGHEDNPLRIIKQLATTTDFVSFKLDIDTPSVEMPLAMKLMSDPSFSSLVDEFFFELHFRCEVMTSCGWGKRVPESSHGLLLDRPHVLQFFIGLRKRGIRAHIWP